MSTTTPRELQANRGNARLMRMCLNDKGSFTMDHPVGKLMGEGWLGGLAERLTDEKEFASRLLGHEERLAKLMFAAVDQLRAYGASLLTDRPKFGDRRLSFAAKKGICPRISVSVPESAVPGFRTQAESAARRGACQTARAAARCWAGRTRGP